MPIIENFKTTLTMDLRDRTLDLNEPGIRIIDPDTNEHVCSILPNERGMYDAHAGIELAAAIRCRKNPGSDWRL